MPLSGAIQRRGGGSGNTLPMTSADTAQASLGNSSVRRRRRVKGGKSKRILFAQIIVLCSVVLAIVLVNRYISPSSGVNDDKGRERSHRLAETSDGGPLPLAKFSSLSYALANTDIVALYFAAAWCPMSTPVTEKLESVFPRNSGTILIPEEEDSGNDLHRPLAIVYVSSDKSDEEMKRYSRDGWISVPYDSPERNGLKRHFRVCAKRELQELGFDRKMEIPTLIIIDSITQGVLTTSGVSDLKEYGEKAVDHWLGLQKLIRGLEDKYEDEERERLQEKRPEPRIV